MYIFNKNEKGHKKNNDYYNFIDYINNRKVSDFIRDFSIIQQFPHPTTPYL
jgi:hypothetical protein